MNSSSKHVGALRQGVDPFGERRPTTRLKLHVLGCEFAISATDDRLLDLVRHAYRGLPKHRFSAPAARFEISLRLVKRKNSSRRRAGAPQELTFHSGAGFLCGTLDAENFVTVMPSQGAALISISEKLLAHPYHVRYEMIEFAFYMLAARAGKMVPLHAACVGARGRGVLIVGESGTGKSTLALHCMLRGLEFMSEDSVMVRARDMLATGVGTFLHLRIGADYFLPKMPRWIRAAPVIRRRSNIRKFEIDMRATPFRLARNALKIVAVVFLSSTRAPKNKLLSPLTPNAAKRRLCSTQAYGATQSGWPEFCAKASRRNCFVLYRSEHPEDQAAAIASLLK